MEKWIKSIACIFLFAHCVMVYSNQEELYTNEYNNFVNLIANIKHELDIESNADKIRNLLSDKLDHLIDNLYKAANNVVEEQTSVEDKFLRLFLCEMIIVYNCLQLNPESFCQLDNIQQKVRNSVQNLNKNLLYEYIPELGNLYGKIEKAIYNTSYSEASQNVLMMMLHKDKGPKYVRHRPVTNKNMAYRNMIIMKSSYRRYLFLFLSHYGKIAHLL